MRLAAPAAGRFHRAARRSSDPESNGRQRLRKLRPSLREGDQAVLDLGADQVFGILRTLPSEQTVLVSTAPTPATSPWPPLLRTVHCLFSPRARTACSGSASALLTPEPLRPTSARGATGSAEVQDPEDHDAPVLLVGDVHHQALTVVAPDAPAVSVAVVEGVTGRVLGELAKSLVEVAADIGAEGEVLVGGVVDPNNQVISQVGGRSRRWPARTGRCKSPA